jgi:hypothetical protein
MTDGRTLPDRLRHGLNRIDAEASGIWEGEALKALKRSFELTLARMESGAAPSRFRFQNTGGKPLLLQGHEALPLEPERLFSLLNAMEVVLQAGEAIDLDGAMAAWLIRPEVNETDNDVRQAESSLQVLKSNRDNRDHGAIQSADSTRIRLRSRLTVLVGALQAANKESEAPKQPLTVNRETAVRPAPAAVASPPPPPPPPPKQETTVRPVPKQETAVRPVPAPEPAPAAAAPEAPAEPAAPSPPLESVLSAALRRTMAAIDGCGFRSALIGDAAHLSWGFTDRPVWNIELIVSIGEAKRETFLSAARGEGLYLSSSSSGSLSLRHIDKKMGTSATIELVEAITPVYQEIVARAKPDFVLNTQVRVASCEDLIVLRTGSDEPGHRESVVHLLRTCAARIDPTYLKALAQKFDIMDELKSAWQEAKRPVDAPTEASGS